MRAILFILIFISFTLKSQKVSISDEIHTPLGTSLNLSTLFGDICPNHLHMGLDFRTNGVEGIPIFSIREGYVSRIRISRGGYGKVLYINHPNGQTSVYAHCSRFYGKIDSLVNNWLVTNEKNEIDTLLVPSFLSVQKGEQIAYSGNSGSSTGPHLHFEIRETSTEIALNPLMHGFNLLDDYAPIIEAIKIVPIDNDGYVLSSASQSVTPVLTSLNNIEFAPQITLSTSIFHAASAFGIMIKGGDRMKSNGNKFDFYKTEVYFDSSLVYQCIMDSISFDHTRYVNDYCDYNAYRNGKVKWNKLFYSSGNPLQIYKANLINSKLKELSNRKVLVQIRVSDMNQQLNTYSFWIIKNQLNDTSESIFSSNNFYFPENFVSKKYGHFNITLEPNSLMQPVKKTQILNGTLPLSKAIHYETKAPPYKPEKCFIKIDGKYNKTSLFDTLLRADTKTLGIPSLAWDTLIPIISPISYAESDSTSSKKILKWVIQDTHSEILDYSLYLNNSFTPIYYDLKSNSITTRIEDFERGMLKIRIHVKDVFDNENIYYKDLILK